MQAAVKENPGNLQLAALKKSFVIAEAEAGESTIEELPASAAQRIADALKQKSLRLDLSNLGLHELPKDIESLTFLEELDISGNYLKEIPDFIGKLTNLRTLNVSSNNLEDLPKNFDQLQNLVSLDISRNRFVNWPVQLSFLLHLRNLNLSGNKVPLLSEAINELASLESLNLANNQLSSLPENVAQLVNLKVLVVSGNNIEQFPSGISNLPTLRELNLSNNTLSTLPDDITKLTNLAELDVSNNRLKEIPSGLTTLLSLKYLNLANNLITNVPTEISQLQRLTFIDLHGNPFESLPEFLSKVTDPSRLYSFLEERTTSVERPLHEAKLLFVGEAGVGKTSLMKRLQGRSFSESESTTKGVTIAPWDKISLSGTPIRLNIWDFGGQTIMHRMHQFFLTKRSIYLLVISSRRGEQESRLEYWLKIIRSHAGDSPIIVVCNKADQNLIQLNWIGLANKYGIHGFAKEVSCIEPRGIDEVQDLITTAVKNLKHIADPIPVGWFDVKSALENLQEPYITFGRFQKIAAQLNVVDTLKQKNLLNFLNDIGTVLWFGDDPWLSNTNVLDPEWVTQAVYHVLTSNILFQQQGVVTLQQIVELLVPRGYSDNLVPFIVTIMERFELCIRMNGTAGQKRLLIPDLLQLNEPDTGDWTGGLHFQFKYDVLPTSVISRFIVRMFRYVADGKYWRTGVVLNMYGIPARIVADPTDKRLSISVVGLAKENRRFLEVIRTELRIIHSSMPDINPIELVPVPGTTSSVSYDLLLQHERLGQETIVILDVDKPISVRELLDGVDPPDKRSSPTVDTLRKFGDPVPPSVRRTLNDLIGVLVKLPVTLEFVGRSALLFQIPGTDGLNRSSSSARADISLIIEQLWNRAKQFSDEHPLAILIDNALPYAGNEETSEVKQLIALKSELAAAY